MKPNTAWAKGLTDDALARAMGDLRHQRKVARQIMSEADSKLHALGLELARRNRKKRGQG